MTTYSARRTLAAMLDKAEISAGRMGKAFDLTNRFILFAQSLPKRSRTTRRDTVKKRVCLQIVFKFILRFSFLWSLSQSLLEVVKRIDEDVGCEPIIFRKNPALAADSSDEEGDDC